VCHHVIICYWKCASHSEGIIISLKAKYWALSVYACDTLPHLSQSGFRSLVHMTLTFPAAQVSLLTTIRATSSSPSTS